MDRWLLQNTILVCATILFISHSSIVLAKSRVNSVTTLLDAKWKTTPLVLEVSEFLAEERNELFWKYIDRICDIDPDFLKDRTDKEYYDIILREAETMLSPPAANLLKFYLSTRAYSPTVEMFHQIAVSQNLPEGCQTVIEINSEFTCDLMHLNRLIETASNRSKSHTYKTDHHYAGLDSHQVVVILYGELATNSFREFHFILQSYAKQGKFDYIIRHFVPDRPDKKVRLSGYGVELSIKSTEYKAQDDAKIKSEGSPDDMDAEEKQDEVEGFVFSKLKKIYPDQAAKLDSFRDHLMQSTNEMLPLKVWQLQELGLQAAERIMASPVEEALRVMRDVSQNFPLQARSLLKQVVRDELRKEISKNQNMFAQNHNLASTDTSMFINGIYFDFDTTDIFAILNVIRQELHIMQELHRLGVDEEQMDKILQLDLGTLKQEYAIDMRDSAIQYINDIETDKKYATWPSSISELLRPTYPGMLRSIRKNIFHLVFIVDPCDKSAKDLLKLAESFYVHRAPIRIGIMFAVGADYTENGYEDCGVAMLNAFNFISQDKGDFYDALAFITDVYATVGDEQVHVENVIKFFRTKYHQEDTEMIFGDDSDYDTGRKLANEFLARTGLEGHPEVMLNGIRLDKKYLNGDMFEEAVLSEIIKQTHTLQKAVYKGLLTDSHNVLDYLMQMPNVMPRVNNRILNDTWKLVDFTGTPLIDVSPAKFADLSTIDMSATVLSHMRYLTARDDNNFRPITNWIIADLETEQGRSLFLTALEQMRLSDIRVGVVFNPTSALAETSHHLSKNVFAALQLLNKKQALAAIGKMLRENTVSSLIQGEKSLRDFVEDIDENAYGKAINSAREMLKIHQRFCKKVLNFQQGEMGIVSNGRILGPFNDEESFTVEDFNLLEKHSLSIYGEKMRDIFQGINSAGELDSISDLSMRVSSLILGVQPSTRVDLKYRSADYSVVKIPPKAQGQPVLDIKVIVNPLSKGAQKASAILAVLHEVVNAKITLFLNSEDKLSDMPLKTFYRFVLEPEVQFASDDSYGPGPIARFNNLPTAPLLTLQMNTPENWLVEVMRTPFDLDNIRLEDVDSAVWSEFELEHLLIEGHCFDLVTGNPPRGLQFTLGTKHNPVMVDTIVMANLGYFQLKANPGAWLLRLRQGRSAKIYDIINHDGTDSPPNSTDVHVVINDFRSTIIKIRVSKKPGKQNVDLLADDDDEKQGIWNSITNKFSGNEAVNKEDDEDAADDKINIFSLASGHLYERLLRIMMLSVVKHAKTPVKFWFLKNYLSPTFKDILPYMAKEYKFEYELVQYKWPRWLHQQTEKQRIIWGYKILFLDVLFPLSVKKIIFVDADQVVRADMTELRDLDLGGAPYGYTPFCDSRKEMDGYRFWKSGYWSSHLQGRKYHISALYVVDLKKFRRIAAGDRLRGQYQGLSQDPNSLSNLDQDLPNNMIHQVYIKSLPQEWLWCETWCDDASKAKAKTIDVCNNPQTKESKLSSASRIISEWKDYDEEIRNLLEKYKLDKAKAAIDPIAKDQKERRPTSSTNREEL